MLSYSTVYKSATVQFKKVNTLRSRSYKVNWGKIKCIWKTNTRYVETRECSSCRHDLKCLFMFSKRIQCFIS